MPLLAHRVILVRDQAPEPEVIHVRAAHRFVVRTLSLVLAVAAEAAQHVQAAAVTRHHVLARRITNRTAQALHTTEAVALEARRVHTVHHLQARALVAAIVVAAHHRAAVVAATAVARRAQAPEVLAHIHRAVLQEAHLVRTRQVALQEVHLLQVVAHHVVEDASGIAPEIR